MTMFAQCSISKQSDGVGSMSGINGAGQRWCILRTSGSRTLALADSLTKAGMEAWTPRRTFKRVKAGVKPQANGQRPTVEIDAPILPTFVFAREADLSALASAAIAEISPHPAFSIFRHGGRHPIIGHASIAGLQQAEHDAAVSIQAQRDAETREAADKIRIGALRNEQARLRAMRAAEADRRKAQRNERRDFDPGQQVTVEEMPALTGMTGVVESSDGRSAVVVFGGALTMTIEAWRLAYDHV